ncbi:helix-turn-helix domain-containing protein [Sulfurisphaera javensis]|uniref:Helix-turn-helix domain-containing protein n=1 Tax=Sulfurisphaera javensis TaxID=2049879 RepID=A0AAT9GVI6_9CREN
MKNLYHVRFSISHKGCWTEKIKNRIRTVKIIDEGNEVKVIIASPYNIVEELRKSENVIKILKYKKLNGGYLIKFLEDKHSSISGFLLNYEDDILDYDNYVYKGIEVWDIITLNNQIVKDLTENFGIANVKVRNIKLDSIVKNNLTEKELLILKTALLMGYFNYPRSVKAKDIAESLGISKQAFLYHIRNSISKLLNSIDFNI